MLSHRHGLLLLLLVVLTYMVPNALLHICMPCSAGRGSFLTLSAAAHAGGSGVHYDASVGPGRAPRRALWVFKVARSGR